jgi:hypothetical protein
MDRRHFLSSSMLTGLGIAVAAPANALTVNACDADNGDSTCRDIAQHDEVFARLDAMLADKGLDEQQRKLALAAARCPFCGNLLAS